MHENVNTTDELGCTPLHYASKTNVETIVTLINAGGDVGCRDKYGYTPLSRAVRFGSMEMVRLLLDKGADVSCRNSFGESLLHCAMRHITSSEEMIKLLLEKGANVAARTENDATALHYALERWGENSVIKELS